MDYEPIPPSAIPQHRPPQGGPWTALFVLATLVLVAWGVPWFWERVEHARARGREHAEVEVIREALPDLKLADVSKVMTLPAKIINPSVVHIDTRQIVQGSESDEFYFLRPRAQEARGQASGIIVDEAGYVLTNYHVVQSAQQIDVHLSDGRAFRAQRLGADPAMDLALLKIDATGIIAVHWADSDRIEVGAPVWAVGNPFGLDRTVTFGIVSAKGRRDLGRSPLQELLQTDAAVNPGNSGGPLVDIEGNVVGINTAIAGPTYIGISFAIPSNAAREVLEQLKSSRPVVRGYLGVALDKPTPEEVQRLGLKDGRGALVRKVGRGSPAEKAGIEPGDLILQWNDQHIEDPTELVLLIARAPANSNAKVTLNRDGKEMPLDVTIAERPTELNQ
jgi:serine protease Do